MSESDINLAASHLEHITFEGKPTEDVTTFLQSVKRVAIAQGRQRDDEWQVDYVESCLAGDALRWFSELEEGTLGSWRTVRNAFLRQFSTPVNRPANAPAAAATPAAPRAAVTQISKYPLPSEVLHDAVKGVTTTCVCLNPFHFICGFCDNKLRVLDTVDWRLWYVKRCK